MKGKCTLQPLGFWYLEVVRKCQMKEIATLSLGHVGRQNFLWLWSCHWGPLAGSVLYNKEMSPSQDYCDDYFKLTYHALPGAQYYGRGALPIYWNYNYGAIGCNLEVDDLMKKGQPSAHDAFVGNWKPTKNDTLSKRFPGFGTTMNILYGDSVCSQGDIDAMNNIISHYQYYLDLMGVGREEAGPHEVLTCGDQKLQPNRCPCCCFLRVMLD
ncbi:hypothetical protein HAX54_025515 [Datura stramonium]|uniref:Glycoside hydrolase family 19 catalytic domain-containing protein n=1 Tax=Datura stramonium TaxID=4076 RepID=A0ABS8RK21_DATST|nr:hypothetical protein [Datura stramonium]